MYYYFGFIIIICGNAKIFFSFSSTRNTCPTVVDKDHEYSKCGAKMHKRARIRISRVLTLKHLINLGLFCCCCFVFGAFTWDKTQDFYGAPFYYIKGPLFYALQLYEQ